MFWLIDWSKIVDRLSMVQPAGARREARTAGAAAEVQIAEARSCTGARRVVIEWSFSVCWLNESVIATSTFVELSL